MKYAQLHHGMRSKPPWRVLFFGTDEFSLKILQSLNTNKMTSHKNGCVVDTVDIAHPKLRKLSPVTRYAEVCDLMQFEWPMDGLRRTYDVGVLASFGHLIPGKLVKMFPYGIINVHPSLLPKWRGAAPLHHTILSGETRTGISIMSIKPKHFDIGPVLLQREFNVPPRATFTSLRDVLAPEGGKLILEVLSNLPEFVVSESKQSEEGISYAHKITQHMSFLNWEQQSVDEIERQYRALHETMELRTNWEGMTVRLLNMVTPGKKTDLEEELIEALGLEEQSNFKEFKDVPIDSLHEPGLPVFDKHSNILWICCKDGWVGFTDVLIKKKMSAKAFYNGYLSKKHFKGVCFKSLENNLFNQKYTDWIKNMKVS